jgi:hypothetical protein
MFDTDLSFKVLMGELSLTDESPFSVDFLEIFGDLSFFFFFYDLSIPEVWVGLLFYMLIL